MKKIHALAFVLLGSLLLVRCGGGGSSSAQGSSGANNYDNITSFDWKMVEGSTIRVLLN